MNDTIVVMELIIDGVLVFRRESSKPRCISIKFKQYVADDKPIDINEAIRPILKSLIDVLSPSLTIKGKKSKIDALIIDLQTISNEIK